MTPTPEIDNAIAVATGVASSTSSTSETSRTCWVYGRMLWGKPGFFDCDISRGRESRKVQLTTDRSLVKRFRDGESEFFLIEMPQHMAVALRIEDLVLDREQIEWHKRKIQDAAPCVYGKQIDVFNANASGGEK